MSVTNCKLGFFQEMQRRAPGRYSPRASSRSILWGAAVAVLAFLEGSGVARAAFPPALVDAMQAELERNLAGLRIDDYPAPYFIAYQLKELGQIGLAGREGAVVHEASSRQRLLRVEVRVGDYGLDNSEDTDGQSYDELVSYQPPLEAPLDDDPAALQHALWLVTDRRYKEALAAYHRVKGKRVYEVDDEDKARPSFTREEPARYTEPEASIELDVAQWSAELRRASARLGANPLLFDSIIELDARKEAQALVNSEGARVETDQVIYGLHVRAYTRADDGMLLDHSVDVYARSAASLPSGAALDGAVDRLIAELLALRVAPVLEPYTGPAILEPQAAGVIFHEAVGHRLEGDRQADTEDGRTFTGQVGKVVLPELVTVYDDPTQTSQGDAQLNGAYAFDDEGVRARQTLLVEKGVLRGFLLRRKPVDGFAASNGHGRAQGNATPAARMGNLVVKAEKTVSRQALKAKLIEEARSQGKPFGLIIGDITGGSTNTSTYGYQAFKGAARMVYKVDAKTGEEVLVRGVEVVGTPLASINKILAAADGAGVFNGYCGAESGYVPVSTVAPAMLFREIELQRSAKMSQKPPLLAPPALRGGAVESRP